MNSNSDTAALSPGRGVTETEGFGTRALQVHAETAMAAVAAQAKAEVESLFVMAAHRPRDIDVVRERLLRECKRPSFADSARYQMPIGKKQDERGQWVPNLVTGLSIRFAEAAIQALGNIRVSARVLFDDDDRRLIKIIVLDLESCVPYDRDIVVEKVVERRKLRKGQTPISSRTNSYGDTVYLVRGSESDMSAKEGALVSKTLRTLGLRLLPGWLKEECERAIQSTCENAAAQDPDATRRRVLDGFSQVGVSAEQVKSYVGHGLDTCTPAEMVELRALYEAVRDGQVTWDDAMEAKRPEDESGNGGGDDEPTEAVRNLKAKLAEAQKKKPEPAPKAKATASEPAPEPDDDARAALEMDLENVMIEKAGMGGTTAAAIAGNIMVTYGRTVKDLPAELLAPIAAALRAGNGVRDIELSDRDAWLRLIASRAQGANIDVAELMAERDISGALTELPDGALRKVWQAVADEVEARG